MLLSDVINKKEVIVKEILLPAEKSIICRDIGIYVGQKLKVIINSKSMPIVLQIMKSQIALDRKTAEKIEVDYD